jgi:hypothetical protein
VSAAAPLSASPRLLGLARVALGAFVLVAVVIGAGWSYLLLGAAGLVWTPFACQTTFHERVTGMPGHDFEVSETSCPGDGALPSDVSVFAARRGPRQQRALLFRYARIHDGSADTLPLITPLDDGTVRFSVDHVASIACRTPRWDGLQIDYRIGRTVHADASPPPQCAGEQP